MKASGRRDDVGGAVAVHVACREREPSMRDLLEGRELAEESACVGVEDLDHGPPPGGTADDDLGEAIAVEIAHGQGDTPAVAVTEGEESARHCAGLPTDHFQTPPA